MTDEVSHGVGRRGDAEAQLRFHVKVMSPDIVAVPIAEVGKLT